MVRWEWKQSPELLHLEKQKNLSTRSYPLRGFPSALKWLWLGSIAATFKWYCRICSVNFDADIGWLWPSQRKGGFNRALRFYLWGAIWFSWSWNRRWKSRFKLARSICKTPEILWSHHKWSPGLLQDIPDYMSKNRHWRRLQDDQQDGDDLRFQADRVSEREAARCEAQPDSLPGVRPKEGDHWPALPPSSYRRWTLCPIIIIIIIIIMSTMALWSGRGNHQ